MGAARQHPIGMGRPLPHGFARHVDHTELSWSHEADGSQRATFAVTSPGAEALRLLLHFDRFPDGVELRFSGYHSAAPISPPLTPEAVALRQSSRGHAYWSLPMGCWRGLPLRLSAASSAALGCGN